MWTHKYPNERRRNHAMSLMGSRSLWEKNCFFVISRWFRFIRSTTSSPDFNFLPCFAADLSYYHKLYIFTQWVSSMNSLFIVANWVNLMHLAPRCSTVECWILLLQTHELFRSLTMVTKCEKSLVVAQTMKTFHFRS